MEIEPRIGQIVLFHSRTGNYSVPAIITATVATLAPVGLKAWFDSEGEKGVPPLSSRQHVHLTVFTPGLPGQRAEAKDFVVESEVGRSENVAGTYQEWDVVSNTQAHQDTPSRLDKLPGTWDPIDL